MDIEIKIGRKVMILFFIFALMLIIGSFSYAYGLSNPDGHGHDYGELSGIVLEDPRLEKLFVMERYCSSGECGSTTLLDGTKCPSCYAVCENFIDCRNKLSEQLKSGVEITGAKHVGPWGGNGITVTIDIPSKETYSLTCSNSNNCKNNLSYWDFQFSKNVKVHDFQLTYLE
jgi:hypothetical protein